MIRRDNVEQHKAVRLGQQWGQKRRVRQGKSSRNAEMGIREIGFE